MQDLDLDELDQAVNNIMTKPRGKRAAKRTAEGARSGAVTSAPAFAPSAPATPQAASDTPGVAKDSDSPAVTPSPRPAEPVQVTVNRPMPRVPERRRMHPGAMDIIQPTAPKMKAPSTQPGRMAAALKPTPDALPEPLHPLAPPTPEPASTPQPEPKLETPQEVSDDVLASLSLLDEKKPTPNFLAPDKPETTEHPMFAPGPKPTAQPTPAKTNDGWPDPLDFHGFNEKPAEALAAPAPKAESAPAEPAVAAPEPTEMPPSLNAEPVSVTDRHDDAAMVHSSPFVTTKVEKRPLGAFTNAAQEPPKAPLPEPTQPPVPQENTSKGELAEASLESKQHLDVPHEAHAADPADLRAMTIPPQYHAAEQKPHDAVHHVFDTKEYHAAPPHMHTAHKSSPALVIGITVLIVLIIAAILVGYFMMTGTFDVTKLW